MKKLNNLLMIGFMCVILANTSYTITKDKEGGFGTFCKQFAIAFAIHKVADRISWGLGRRTCIVQPIITIGGILLAQQATNHFHQKVSEEKYTKTHLFAGLLAWIGT